MKIICVEEHPVSLAMDRTAQLAVPGETPFFGLTGSLDAAAWPRNVSCGSLVQRDL